MFDRPAKKKMSGLRATARLATLAAYATGLAAFVACATAPDDGFLPVIVESPAPHSSAKGFAPKQGDRVSKVYIRPDKKGRWPLVANAGESFAFPPEEGIVSWYGYDHIGRKTATGEWFNPQAMTAAHKTLPFGTIVRVTRLDTGHSVEVEINDRGPYIDGRIIDLARKPAAKMDLLNKGIAPCKVEVLKYPLVEMAGPRGNG